MKISIVYGIAVGLESSKVVEVENLGSMTVYDSIVFKVFRLPRLEAVDIVSPAEVNTKFVDYSGLNMPKYKYISLDFKYGIIVGDNGKLYAVDNKYKNYMFMSEHRNLSNNYRISGNTELLNVNIPHGVFRNLIFRYSVGYNCCDVLYKTSDSRLINISNYSGFGISKQSDSKFTGCSSGQLSFHNNNYGIYNDKFMIIDDKIFGYKGTLRLVNTDVLCINNIVINDEITIMFKSTFMGVVFGSNAFNLTVNNATLKLAFGLGTDKMTISLIKRAFKKEINNQSLSDRLKVEVRLLEV